jgi:Ala-tRNA(Pro) deacylase
MPVSQRLTMYLERNGVRYVAILHGKSGTAAEVAASLDLLAREVAKVVVVDVEGEYVMLVLPASRRVDFGKIADLFDGRQARLVPEAELRELFPDCEVGGMPPFGNLYGLEVLCDASLAEDEEIAFNAGSTTWAIRMSFADFQRLARPTIAVFAMRLVAGAAAREVQP